MTNRTLDDIKKDLREAMTVTNFAALQDIVEKLYALGTEESKALAERTLGSIHHMRGQYEDSLRHFRTALAINEQLGDRSGMAGDNLGIGNAFTHSGRYQQALEHYHRALALHEELGERFGIARVLGGLGNIYYATGDYPKALKHYHRSLDLNEELNSVKSIATQTGNIGIVHSATGNHQKALEYYQRSLDLYNQIGDPSGIAHATSHIAAIHHKTGNDPLALEYFDKALATFSQLGDHGGMARVTVDTIHVHLKAGSFEIAESLLNDFERVSVSEPAVAILRHVARAKIHEHHGHLEDAVNTLREALATAREHSLQPEQADVHKHLRDLSRKLGNFDAYIEHNDEYVRITQSIDGKETAEKLAIIESDRRMENERREREKERAVLYSALPKHIADRVIRGEKVSGDSHERACVLFLDIVGFTQISNTLTPVEVVTLLEKIFSSLDDVCRTHGITKIKTIGDSYMAVALPDEFSGSEQRTTSVEERMASAAVEMLQAVSKIESPTVPRLTPSDSPTNTFRSPERSHVSVRIGVHCGAVTAGVIGTERLQYDVWGDTVNVASRLESTGEPDRIHVSEAFAHALPSDEIHGTWHLALRGETELKGRGTMITYWLEPRV